jgi:hypothetical protein
MGLGPPVQAGGRRQSGNAATTSALSSTDRCACSVQLLAAELDALDAESVHPIGLIADNFGKHPFDLSPSP